MDRLTFKAAREKFKQCTWNQLKEIKECPITDCATWPYRMGRRPQPEDLVLLSKKGVK